jgi:hypothetical protein
MKELYQEDWWALEYHAEMALDGILPQGPEHGPSSIAEGTELRDEGKNSYSVRNKASVCLWQLSKSRIRGSQLLLMCGSAGSVTCGEVSESIRVATAFTKWDTSRPTELLPICSFCCSQMLQLRHVSTQFRLSLYNTSLITSSWTTSDRTAIIQHKLTFDWIFPPSLIYYFSTN